MKFKINSTLPVLFLVLWCVSFTVITFLPEQEVEEIIVTPPSQKSEFFPKENVQGRNDYLQQVLANPATGRVPANALKMEQAFANELNFQADLARIKKSKAGSSSSASTNLLTWSSLGPNNVGGRTRAIALDVRDENVIIAGGVSGGVWRSENGGQTWTKTTTPEQLHSVTCVVQDTRPGKQNIWYYGTGELVGNSARAPGAPFRGDGIYKSVDGGRSWQPLPSTQVNEPENFISPFMYVWDITLNPNSANDEIIAAIYGGIIRSADGGQTWNTVLGNSLYEFGGGVDLNILNSIFYTDVHRAPNGVFYATLSRATNVAGIFSPLAGVYLSTDGIDWFRVITHTRFPYRRTEIGSSPSEPNIVYFLSDTGIGHQLVKYNTNTGLTEDRSAGLPDGSNDIESFDSQSSYDLFVRVHPNNTDVVYIGGTNLYRSTNGFANQNNTSLIGGYSAANTDARYENHHPDQHDLVFLPSNPNVMISANDGGLFRTNDNLASTVAYESLNNGYITTQYYTITLSQSANDDFAFGGLQDNGSLLSPLNAGSNAFRLIGGDGGYTASTKFGINYYASFQNGQVYRLTLNANFNLTSFARVDPVGAGANPSQSILFINPFVLDNNNGNRMFYAGGDFIWRNRNLSQIPSGEQTKTNVNWDRLDRTLINSGSISALETSTIPENILYYGTLDGQVFKVLNAHSDEYSVGEITSNLFPAGGYINSIAVNPTNGNELIVVFSNYEVLSVFRSIDGGQTFESISGNLEENANGVGSGPSVRWAEIVPKEAGAYDYFLATSIGLFSTSILDGNNTVWNQEGSNSIGNVPVNMLDYRRIDGQIVAATHGNGLYASNINGVLPETIISTPGRLTIEPPFPNPFVSELTIKFNVPETDFIRVRVYDSRGRLIKTIASGLGFTGENEIFWDGTDVSDNPVPPGLYIIRIEYRDQIEAQKVIYSR